MKSLQDKQQGLRTRLRNNQREIYRLMNDYENFNATVVTGSDIPDMDEWLVEGRPKRRAAKYQSPDPLDQTQTTDASTQPSQPSVAASEALAAAEFSDDYTASSEDSEEEERSVNTDTGMPDTQACRLAKRVSVSMISAVAQKDHPNYYDDLVTLGKKSRGTDIAEAAIPVAEVED